MDQNHVLYMIFCTCHSQKIQIKFVKSNDNYSISFQFTGVWYGIQAENTIPACEIFKMNKIDDLSYLLSTEIRVSTPNNKYKAKYTETLTVPDNDVLSKMSVSPLPREILFKLGNKSNASF